MTYTFSANLGGIIVLLFAVVMFIAGIRWAFTFDAKTLGQEKQQTTNKVEQQ